MESQPEGRQKTADSRESSHHSFSSSVIGELEARQDPFPTLDQNAARHKMCNLCQQRGDLVAHQVIPDREGDSQVYDSKALGLFLAEGFDVGSAQNGILVCRTCHQRLRQRFCLLTLPTALLQLLDERTSSLLELAEDPIRAQSRKHSRITFNLFGELRNLAVSDDRHKYLLGHYQVLHHAMECLDAHTKPVDLCQDGLADASKDLAGDPQSERFHLVLQEQLVDGELSAKEHQPCAGMLWRLRGVSPAAVISELFACFKAGQLTPDVLCNQEQRENAEVAIKILGKLGRLLNKARTTDKGPQPLYAALYRAVLPGILRFLYSKESLVNLVPVVHLDRLSLLDASSTVRNTDGSAASTVAPPIDDIPDSHIRPPPTDERKFRHGGRDTTTDQNVQRYQDARRKQSPETLLPLPAGDPQDDESTKVSPDVEWTSREL